MSELESKEVFVKSYDDESLYDLHRDMSDALDAEYLLDDIPTNDNGFMKGIFVVTIKWYLEASMSEKAAMVEVMTDEIACAESALESVLVRFPDAPTDFKCIGSMATEAIKRLEQERDELRKDAERYRWLRQQKGLHLTSDCMAWTREDLTTFVSSHRLSAGNTAFAPQETLDETIDAAIAQEPKPCQK